MTDQKEEQPQQVFVPVNATQAAASEPEKTEGKDGDKPKKKSTKGDGLPAGQVAAGGVGATVLGSYALASAVGPWGWAAAPAAGAVAGAGYLYHRRRKQRQEKATKTTITRTRTRGSKTWGGGGFAGFRGRSGVSSTSAKRSGGLSSPAGKSGSGWGSAARKGSTTGAKPAGAGQRGAPPKAGGSRGWGSRPGSSSGRGGGLFRRGSSPRNGGSVFGGRKSGGSGGLTGRRHGGTDPTTSSKRKGPGMTTQSRWGRARDAIGRGASRLADATRKGTRRTADAADRKTGRRATTGYKAAAQPKGLRARWEAARTALANRSGRPWVNRAFAAGAVGVAAVAATGARANQWARNRANQNLNRYTPAEEPDAAPESTVEATQPLPDPEPTTGPEQPQERPEPAAAAAPSATPTITTSSGGTTMAGLPAAQIAHDMAGAMSRYTPADAYQIVPESKQWVDVPTQVAMSVKAYVDRLEGMRFPIDQAITDKLHELAQAIAATRSIAEEIEPLMRKAHAKDIDRQESPRGDESKWNL